MSINFLLNLLFLIILPALLNNVIFFLIDKIMLWQMSYLEQKQTRFERFWYHFYFFMNASIFKICAIFETRDVFPLKHSKCMRRRSCMNLMGFPIFLQCRRHIDFSVRFCCVESGCLLHEIFCSLSRKIIVYI